MTIVSANDTPEQIAEAMRAHGFEAEIPAQPQANPADVPPSDAPEDAAELPLSSEGGTTGTDSDPERTATEQVPQAKNKRSKIQERIDELTAQRYQEKGRADHLEQELAALRSQLAGIPPKPEDGAPVLDEQAGPALLSEPVHPGKTPRLKDFESMEDYEVAMDDHDSKLEQYQKDIAAFNRQESRLEAQRQFEQQEQQRVQAETQAQWNAKLEAAKTELPDFEDVMKAATSQISAAMMDTVQESDLSPKILYWLAQHPEDANAIFAQTYYDLQDRNAERRFNNGLIANRNAARAVARIEAELAKSAPSSAARPASTAVAPGVGRTAAPAPRQFSNAPNPITPTRGGGTSSSPDPRSRVIGQNGWTADKERALMAQQRRRR